MSADFKRVKDLFLAAAEVTDPAARAAYLDTACGGDTDVRRRVEELLCDEPTGDFLERPAVAIPPPATGLPAAPPGYTLATVVGRGGMGVVYRAQDTRLNRDVAVKLLRPTAATDPTATARFVHEAGITARLQHPGVPPVHEVGELPDGRPFLVMKLVEGRTLADLLADRPAPSADRGRFVAVFEGVCQAVGYAHSKGVIHRDLKPANVMVGAFGEVQVMDWGLAKDMASRERERPEESTPPVAHAPGSPAADLTRTGSVMGTAGYMAPEQARGEPADRRSDVFGLGAVLCEILTGRPPLFDDDWSGVLRATASGDLTAARESLARCGADPELVAVCERCLDPNPDVRPADAGELATAVAEWRARADDRARRAEVDRAAADARAGVERKRRRGLLRAAGVVAAVLTTGVGVSAWQAVRATAAEAATADQLGKTKQAEADARTAEEAARGEAADTRAFSTFLVEHVLAAGRPAGLQGGLGKDVTMVDALREAEKRVDEVFAGRPKAEATARHALGVTWRTLARNEDAERHLRRAVELRKRELGPIHPDTLDSLNSLAVVCEQRGKFDDAERLMKEALDGHRSTSGPNAVETLTVAVNLGFLYVPRGRADEALRILGEVEAIAAAAHGRRHPVTLSAVANQGIAHARAGRGAEAEAKLAEALAGRREALGDKHPTTIFTMRELGNVYRRLNRRADADRLFTEALAAARGELGDQHPETLMLLTKLALLRFNEGKHAAAGELLDEALPPSREVFGRDHPHTLEALQLLAAVRERQRRPADAAACYEEALAGFRTREGARHFMTVGTARQLGMLYRDMKKPADAAERLAEALAGCAGRPATDQEREVCQSYLGVALVEAGKYADAEPHLKAAFTTLTGRTTPTAAENERLRLVVRSLADVCDHTDRAADAAVWRAKLPRERLPAPRPTR